MASSISKNTIVHDIWENFYDRVNSQVTTVTLANSDTQTVQTYSGSYSDHMLNKKSNYPILVVGSPVISSEYFTTSKDSYLGTITITIFTTSSEAGDRFISEIIDSIETHRQEYRDVNLTMIDLQGIDNDMVERGNIKIHVREATYSFEYHFVKS